MTDPVEPDAHHDWRVEVDWPRVRRLAVLHGVLWAFGAAQTALFWAGMLTGTLRTLAGAADYLAWAALLVLSFRIVRRPRPGPDNAGNVSGPTFLVLLAFVASLCAYILLLSLIDLGTIELF